MDVKRTLKCLKDACSFEGMTCKFKLTRSCNFTFACMKSSTLSTKHQHLGVCEFPLQELISSLKRLNNPFSFEGVTYESKLTFSHDFAFINTKHAIWNAKRQSLGVCEFTL